MIQSDLDRLPIQAEKRDARRMRQAVRILGEDSRDRRNVTYSAFQSLPQALHPLGSLMEFRLSQTHGICKAGGQDGHFRPRSQPQLLGASVVMRFDHRAMPQHERSNSERSMEFMRRHGHRIGGEILKAQRHLAEALDGVGMERNPRDPAEFSDRLNRLQDSGFIVGEHDRDACDAGRIFIDPLSQDIDIDDARRRTGQVANGSPARFQILSRPQNARMLDARDHDAARPSRSKSEEGQIVRLGTAAGKYELIARHSLHSTAACVEELFSRVLQDLSCATSGSVLAARVRQSRAMQFGHVFRNARVDQSRGVVIEIDHERFDSGACGFGEVASEITKGAAACF